MALADELLSTSEADIDKFGLIFLYPGTVETRAIYHVQTGEYDRAVQAADHLSDFSILDGNDFYLGISHRIKALAALGRGRYAEAADWAQKAILELNRSRRGDIHLSMARQILGIALFHTGDHARARNALETVLAYFTSIGAGLGGSETALCLGVLLHETGDDAGAGDCLKTGLEKAMANGYGYFPLIDHRILARAAVTACTQGIAPGRKVSDFLARFKAPDLLTVVADTIETALKRLPKGEKQRARRTAVRPL